MKRVALIRHGETAGNLEGRYIGTTDEPLCEAGKAHLRALQAPRVEQVFISPLLRCRESARLLFPRLVPVLAPDLRECDFGRFENKTYRELDGDEDYQRWIDSGGTLPFPGGERREDFIQRCVSAFDALDLARDSAILAHGGTLMAILSARALPRRDYFDWQVPCACGYLCDWDGKALRVKCRIGF